MPLRVKSLLTFAVFACALWSASAAFTVAPQVSDEGKFFSAAAVKKANERIRDIYSKHHRDVLIETFASVPTGDLEKVRGMDAKSRTKYFTQWAQERSKERVVNGLYVLLCKEPHYLIAGINEGDKRLFTPDIRAAVEEAFRKELKEERYDQGLDQAMKVIEEKLSKK